MILVSKRNGVKIRIDGKDGRGKNTTRAILVADATVDQVTELIKWVITEESLRPALKLCTPCRERLMAPAAPPGGGEEKP